MEGRSSSTFSCHILLFMLDVEVFRFVLFFQQDEREDAILE